MLQISQPKERGSSSWLVLGGALMKALLSTFGGAGPGPKRASAFTRHSGRGFKGDAQEFKESGERYRFFEHHGG